MRRLIVATFVLTAALAGPAKADPAEYGIESVSAVASAIQAGAHPDLTISVRLKKDPKGFLPSTTKDVYVDLPPGLLANPNSLPKCSAAQLVSVDLNDKSNKTGCPQASQIGIVEVELFNEGFLLNLFEPIYNMEPRSGEPARLGFVADVLPVLIDTRLRPEDGYGATAIIEGASSVIPLVSAVNTIWGVPADEAHDAQRITPYEALHGGSPETSNGKRPPGLALSASTLNPTRCATAQGVDFTLIPYALPDLRAEGFAPMTPNSGCGGLDFKPKLSIAPTSIEAESGTGLNVALTFPQAGLKSPTLPTEAAQKRVVVTLPEGMTINPAQATGLEACTPSMLAGETATSAPGEGCPEASKIGSAVAESPLLNEIAEGSLYVAEPYDNPFHSLIAVYLVIKVPERGVIVKLAGKVEPDLVTGQLVTTFDDIPQLPVSSFVLHFREGARSPLVMPPQCGTYVSTARFTSWARPESPAVLYPPFQVSQGANGGPCPTDSPPFHPGFVAGAINNNGGSYSPEYLRLTRPDGDQELTRFSVVLPAGLVAKLAGVSRCSDASIAVARTRSGQDELRDPSCPGGAEIGHVLGGAGVGPAPFYASGKLYLAGPYNGDPLSVVGIVPAVAGPFDIGTVVTRQGLSLDPETGVARVDGTRSDPLPRILAGIPLRVRDIQAHVDRPEFTLNPTSCDHEAFMAQLWGGGGNPLDSADDVPLSLATRFQAANCSRLGFRPQLSLKLEGGTRRGASPALRAVLKARRGDANIGAVQVTLPRSTFIEQAHFRTICTRVQFNGKQCPAGSIYGHVKAFTPLLDEPLEGPVYLRSSSHQLPDLVFALHGIVDIDVVGRIDSVHGRLRSSFESVPDAPVSKVVLQMQGGLKSLIVNSTNLCARTNRASADFTGQNGKNYNFNPTIANSCTANRQKHGKRGMGKQKHA